jgi:colanic acid biosynthesis protein WcaH
MSIPAATFRDVVRHAPLISIDLVVQDAQGRVLLGLRTNRPARGTWFVPGGRIHKGETLEQAFRRISQAELGVALERGGARFLGVYEHFYPDNAFGEDFGTHYVVLGYALTVDALPALPREQHQEYRWWPVEELLAAKGVHPNTQAYFRP